MYAIASFLQNNGFTNFGFLIWRKIDPSLAFVMTSIKIDTIQEPNDDNETSCNDILLVFSSFYAIRSLILQYYCPISVIFINIETNLSYQ